MAVGAEDDKPAGLRNGVSSCAREASASKGQVPPAPGSATSVWGRTKTASR
jgi:hypothetical protein